MANFGNTSLNSLKGVHPDLVKVMTEAIKNTPIDFTITNGVRTAAEQQALYAKGRTKPGQIVTKADGLKNKSNHQVKADGYGHAVDLYAYKNGSIQFNDVASLKIIGVHIKTVASKLGIPIAHGMDWKTMFDPPHFELK